jgi:hypothetical protein
MADKVTLEEVNSLMEKYHNDIKHWTNCLQKPDNTAELNIYLVKCITYYFKELERLEGIKMDIIREKEELAAILDRFYGEALHEWLNT